jgi:hypothetical protein
MFMWQCETIASIMDCAYTILGSIVVLGTALNHYFYLSPSHQMTRELVRYDVTVLAKDLRIYLTCDFSLEPMSVSRVYE